MNLKLRAPTIDKYHYHLNQCTVFYVYVINIACEIDPKSVGGVAFLDVRRISDHTPDVCRSDSGFCSLNDDIVKWLVFSIQIFHVY